MKLDTEPAPQFQVLVGSENFMKSQGFVRNLNALVQGHNLNVPAYLLPVAGTDLILEVEWLATLGPHVADFNELTLRFF